MTSENTAATHNKPHIDLKNAKICCDQITEEFESFDKDLTLIITISGIQDNNATLIEKQNEILSLPKGQELHNKLKAYLQDSHHTSKAVGIIAQEHKTLLGLKSKQTFTALMVINAKEHIDKQALKTDIYAQIWSALSIIEDIQNENTDFLNIKDNLTTARWNDAQTASRNMFADIFAGSLAELKGQKGALKNLAKKRAIACFEDLQFYHAQSNPLPIMLETTLMVYDDIGMASHGQKNTITTALNITSEIIETMDDNTIAQWQNFITSAREMAWADLSISQILGTAIYTSDNVYNRTSAYMIAEILNTDPAPIVQFDGYNAFADIDSQQRIHKLACLETFEFVQSRQMGGNNADPFFKMALQSCEMLLSGKPNGFCAPALIAAGQNIIKTPDITKEELSRIFSEHINNLSWGAVRDIHKAIIDLRKLNRCDGLNSIIEVMRNDEEARDSAILIKQLTDTQT